MNGPLGIYKTVMQSPERKKNDDVPLTSLFGGPEDGKIKGQIIWCGTTVPAPFPANSLVDLVVFKFGF